MLTSRCYKLKSSKQNTCDLSPPDPRTGLRTASAKIHLSTEPPYPSHRRSSSTQAGSFSQASTLDLHAGGIALLRVSGGALDKASPLMRRLLAWSDRFPPPAPSPRTPPLGGLRLALPLPLPSLPVDKVLEVGAV